MSKKHTIEFIKSEFEKEKWTLVSTKYINNKSSLNYICPKGHHGSITWSDWKQGCRCLECSGRKKHTLGFIKAEFEKDKYKLKSKEYINAHSKLDYICPKGHLGSITWDNWNHGKRCSICSGSKKHTIKFVKWEFKKEKYTCISKEYINNKTPLKYICPKGHKGTISWDNWKHGRRCPRCSKTGKSIWEDIVKKFVKSLGITFLENDRTLILNPNTNRHVELDLWFPDLNKAIECNSEYWHKNRKHIDSIKQEWCKNNNVSLFNIDFDEWKNDIKKCQTKIKEFLN